MARRVAALVFIFAGTTIGWIILGATIFSRTYDLGASSGPKVASSWGTQQRQSPPTASFYTVTARKELVAEGGQLVERTVKSTETTHLPLDSSKINVGFDVEYRQKGLLWYTLYKVNYQADYGFTNNSGKEQKVYFRLQFPAENAIYDDLVFAVDGEPLAFSNVGNAMEGSANVAAGKTALVRLVYRSHGQDRWYYNFGQDVSQVKNFSLAMKTNFKDIDFPENALSPTSKRETSDGWELEWNYKNLISGLSIGMVMPEKLQPGPLAGRISFFAPVSLFFFFFLIFIITTLRNIDLHPMNYFFLAAAFFAFHLLLAYTVDHISIHAAFLISSLVSIFLVVSYLRLVLGIRFAAVEAALAQLVYLVFFSYAFFFKGFTGLTVTVIAIITLFIVMQMTGKVNWNEKFARQPMPTRA
ncbi:MAG: inner membrane CreD family protein [Acidobacteriales bacterium]|nr:inner membrane CreD family protein [Terriglobales bacterium]